MYKQTKAHWPDPIDTRLVNVKGDIHVLGLYKMYDLAEDDKTWVEKDLWKKVPKKEIKVKIQVTTPRGTERWENLPCSPRTASKLLHAER